MFISRGVFEGQTRIYRAGAVEQRGTSDAAKSTMATGKGENPREKLSRAKEAGEGNEGLLEGIRRGIRY